MAYTKLTPPVGPATDGSDDLTTQGSVGARVPGTLDADHKIPARARDQDGTGGADVQVSVLLDAIDFFKVDNETGEMVKVVLSGTPPAAPVANTLYKHPDAGGAFVVPLKASSVNAALAGVLDAAQGSLPQGAVEGFHEIGGGSEPAFINSWANFGGAFNSAGFMKLPSGLVVLKGLVKDGTPAAVIFTLPVGYRPVATVMKAVVENAAFARLEITSAGNVASPDGSNVFLSLEVSFMAGA